MKLQPDKGFDRIPGKSTPEQRAKLLQRLDPELRKAVEQEAGMIWKPLMSKAEAEAYTRDSYYQGQDFYHGTAKEAATGILSEGARLISDVVNSFGDGFYLAFDRNAAIDYANQNPNPALLTAKVLAKNPKKFADSLAVESFLEANNIPFDDNQSTELTKILKLQGFDSIEVGGNRILVIIFAKQQIAVFNSEDL